MRPAAILFALLCCSLAFAQQSPLDQAWSLAASGRGGEAIQLLQQLVVKEPANADIRLLLGSLLMEKGDEQNSIEQLQTAVKLRPKSADAQNALGEAYSRFGQTDAAKTAFENAVALKPDDGIAQSNLGRMLLEEGQVDQAGKHLDRAIALLGRSDDAADAHYLRAKIHALRSQTGQAAKQLEAAVAIRAQFPEAWSDLGQARSLLLDGPGAISALQHAVNQNPNDPVAQYRLGAEYLRDGKTEPALEHLRKSYQLNPNDQSTLNSLQMALRQHGDVEQADQIRKQLADLLRDRDRVNQNKLAAVRINNEGAALEKSGDLPGALDKYRQATQLDPTHVGIRINYGVALLRLGHWEEGLNILHTALQQEPNNRQLRAAMQDALAQAPSWAIPAWAKNRQIP